MKVGELIAAIRTEAAKELAATVVDSLDIEDIKVAADGLGAAVMKVALTIPETKLTVKIPIGRVLDFEEQSR